MAIKDSTLEVNNVDYWEEESYEEEPATEENDAVEQEINTTVPERKRSPQNEENGTRKKQKADYNTYEQYYQQPSNAAHHAVPPVPPIMNRDDEGLSNLIMAWYYAGYYTGLYQVSISFNSLLHIILTNCPGTKKIKYTKIDE